MDLDVPDAVGTELEVAQICELICVRGATADVDPNADSDDAHNEFREMVSNIGDAIFDVLVGIIGDLCVVCDLVAFISRDLLEVADVLRDLVGDVAEGVPTTSLARCWSQCGL